MSEVPPARCRFFLQKKSRCCKMIVGKGRTFCGEHAFQEEGNSRRRIPCPLDPKHTVFEEKLSKHLKHCNSREKPKPIYFEKDVNAGSEDEDQLKDQMALGDRSKAELDLQLEKLTAAVKGLDLQFEESFLSHPALSEELNNPNNGDSAFKHLKQQASILGNLEVLHLLGSNKCFLEFGAGRGKLSHWIHEAMKEYENYHFLLVERSSTRFKVDGKHQQVDAKFERLQVDIQHLDLSKVPLLKEKRIPLVGVGKHLCGAATDLALRCLFERPERSSEPPSKRLKPEEGSGAELRAEEPHQSEVCGLAVALCCHHRCEWRHYVGKSFFQQRGLGAAEFETFQRMSSWATCGLRSTSGEHEDGEQETEEKADPEGLDGVLSAEERQTIGRRCKQLIDVGRVHYLQSKGYSAKLKYYTGEQVTLENVLLTAVPSNEN